MHGSMPRRQPRNAASCLAIMMTSLAVGCGGGGGEKTVTVRSTDTTTTTTSASTPGDLVRLLVACLNRAGANARISEERPPNDQANFQPMVHAVGYLDAVDAWRSTGGYYIWVYHTHAQAEAAIRAQQASDTREGYAGLNKDLRAFENLAVGPRRWRSYARAKPKRSPTA